MQSFILYCRGETRINGVLNKMEISLFLMQLLGSSLWLWWPCSWKSLMGSSFFKKSIAMPLPLPSVYLYCYISLCLVFGYQSYLADGFVIMETHPHFCLLKVAREGRRQQILSFQLSSSSCQSLLWAGTSTWLHLAAREADKCNWKKIIDNNNGGFCK